MTIKRTQKPQKAIWFLTATKGSHDMSRDRNDPLSLQNKSWLPKKALIVNNIVTENFVPRILNQTRLIVNKQNLLDFKHSFSDPDQKWKKKIQTFLSKIT